MTALDIVIIVLRLLAIVAAWWAAWFLFRVAHHIDTEGKR